MPNQTKYKITISYDGEEIGEVEVDIDGDEELSILAKHSTAMMIVAEALAVMAENTPAVAGEGPDLPLDP